MSTALGLAMQISANTAQLAQAVQDVNKRLDQMGQAGKKAADDLGVLKNIEIAKFALDGITAAGSAFLSLSKSVLGCAESLINFGKSVADQLDSLNDVANRTGVNVEALQAYSAAAKLAGTDVETFAKSLQKLTINIGKAVGSEKAQQDFKKLGVVFEDLRDKSPTEQFEAIADAIARIADPAERAAAAVKFFGKGGIELGPLFAEGPGALTKMREEAVALGQVVSGESIQSIAKMNDAFDKVWMTLKGITGQIVGELAGPIAQIAEDLLGVVKQIGATNIANTVAQGLIDFIGLAGNAFFLLAKFIEGFVKKFAPVLGIDISTEAQKELARLRQQQINNREIDPTGGFVGARNADTPEAKRRAQRIAELEAQVAAEQASSVLDAAQANFNRAINSAAARLDQAAKPPQADRQAAAPVAPVQEASGDAKKQTELLEDIKENTRPPATVELPG